MKGYDTSYDPPALVVGVRVSRPIDSEDVRFLKGLIDTGADMFVISKRLINELQIVPAGEVIVLDFDGDEREKTTYYVFISINDFEELVEVISLDFEEQEDVIIGRDILNNLTVVLNGKNLSFEIKDP